MEIFELHSLSWGILFSMWSTCSSFPLCDISIEPAPSVMLLPRELFSAVCSVRCDLALKDHLIVKWLDPRKNQVPQYSSRTPQFLQKSHFPRTPVSQRTSHPPDASCVYQILVVAGSGPDIAGTYTCSVTSGQPAQLILQQTLHVHLYDDGNTGHEVGTLFQTQSPYSNMEHIWREYIARDLSARSQGRSLPNTTSALVEMRRRRNVNSSDTTGTKNSTIASEAEITNSNVNNNEISRDNSSNSSTDRQESTSGVTSPYSETSNTDVTGVVESKTDSKDDDEEGDYDHDSDADTAEDAESGVDEGKLADSCSHQNESALGKYGLLALLVTVSVAFLVVLALLLILVLPRILSRKHQAEIKCETYNLTGPSKFASVPFTSSILVETADVPDSRTLPEVTKTVTDSMSEREVEAGNNKESRSGDRGESEVTTTENGLEVTEASVSTFLLRQLSQKEGRAEDIRDWGRQNSRDSKNAPVVRPCPDQS